MIRVKSTTVYLLTVFSLCFSFFLEAKSTIDPLGKITNSKNLSINKDENIQEIVFSSIANTMFEDVKNETSSWAKSFNEFYLLGNSMIEFLGLVELPRVLKSYYSTNNKTANLFIGPGDPTCNSTDEIGGIVFQDYDADGVKDVEEHFLYGLSVSLYDDNGQVGSAVVSDNDGEFLFTGLTVGAKYRLEFSIPLGMEEGPVGADSNTSIQFVTAGACNANLGLLDPSDYCDNDPFIVTPCYAELEHTGTYSGEVALVKLLYSDDGHHFSGTTKLPSFTGIGMATHNQIGATYGMAWQRTHERLYLGAFHKRYVDFGPSGPDAIYQTDLSGTITGVIQLDNYLPGSNTTGADVHDFTPSGGEVYDIGVGNASYDGSGKRAFGDLEISSDNKKLYAVNLFDKKIYEFDISTGLIVDVVISNSWDAPDETGAARHRPFALAWHRGKIWVGSVDENASEAYVHSLNLSTGVFTLEVTVDLSYTRQSIIGEVATDNPADWNAWDSDPASTPYGVYDGEEIFYPQPILSDIEFDGENMMLGFRDRFGDQSGGEKKFDPSTGTTTWGDAGGDLIKVCSSNGTYTLETGLAGSCPGVGGLNNSGPNGYEFYHYDMYHDEISWDPNSSIGGLHWETTQGGLLQLSGKPSIITTAMDPFHDFSGGVLKLDNADGGREGVGTGATTYGALTGGYTLYETGDYITSPPSNNGTAAKGNGLGDLEAFCAAAPLEIGNFVWSDSNGNGIQNPSEVGIAGVTVILTDASDVVLGTVTTDSDGKYTFTNTDVSGDLEYFTDYKVKINLSDIQSVVSSINALSNLNTGNGFNDNDASLIASVATIDLTTGGPGETNHSADFGFTESSAIGNKIWIDENGDGLQDVGEPGIANVVVELVDDNTSLTVSSVKTDANGGYLFPNVAPGDYTIRVLSSSLPDGLIQTSNPVNPDADLGNQTAPYSLTVDSGGEKLFVDFGYNWGNATDNTGNGALGNRVWNDLDNSGIQDAGELGIAGVTLRIYYDSNSDGIIDPSVDAIYTSAVDQDGNTGGTATTESDGTYIFHNLPTGIYSVVLDDTTLPGGSAAWSQSGDPDDFAKAATDPDHKSDEVIVAPGDTYLNVDFGYHVLGSSNRIGNQIWVDENGNGVFDLGERPLEGVSVTLLDDSNNTITTKDTDENGNYIFTDLPNGTYTIWVNDANNILAELTQTVDPDATLDVKSTVTLTGGINDLSHDFGFLPAGHTSTDGLIGDLVYLDLNNNGSADIGEGIENVSVELFFGYEVIDGRIDINGDDAVNGSDDGTIGTLTIINGRPDLNDDGSVDGSDDGVLYGETVINARLDMDGNGLVNAANRPNDDGFLAVSSEGIRYTDENGNYLFGSLSTTSMYAVIVDESTIPGTVTNFDDPDGSNDSESMVDLNATGPRDLDQDFGYEPTGTVGSIGNLVWADSNADGTKDSGEDVLEGITLDLYWDKDGNGMLDSGEPKVGSQTTDNSGAYSFGNLPVDGGVSYIVDVSDTDSKLLGAWHSRGTDDTNDESQADAYDITLTSGSPNSLVADFGYYVRGAAVGNFVWEDKDVDGLQDNGELGLIGVKVNLEIDYNGDTNSEILLASFTDNTGHYSFDGLLLDESYNSNSASLIYTISVETPNNFEATLIDVNANANDKEDSEDPSGTIVQVIQGERDTDQETDPTTEANSAITDFGFIEKGTIGNIVWVDENGDGAQDIGEPGIPNVAVILYNDLAIAIDTVITDDQGGYVFQDVKAGTYTVSVDPNSPGTLPNGLTQTTLRNAGGDFGNQSPVYSVVLRSGEENMTADFGYNWGDANGNTGVGAIGDRVWNDANNDGLQDIGEAGIGGVTVSIYADSDGDGYVDPNKDNLFTSAINQNGITGTGMTTTDASGRYIFHGLPVGQYIIVIDDSTLPGGTSAWIQSGDPDERGVLAMSPDHKSNRVILGPGDTYLNVDFGYNSTGTLNSVGDLVWFDENGDGTFNAGEEGLSGISVSLIDASDKVVATMLTDDSGNYLFSDIQAGTYTIAIIDRDNVLSELTQSADPDAIKDGMSTIVLAGGTTNLIQDFGYKTNGQDAADGLIGNMVFLDRNGNGTGDDGEGMEGVSVSLYDATGSVLMLTTTTDENGHYYFGDLDPTEKYTVYIDALSLPGGLSNTTDPDGGANGESLVNLNTSGPRDLDQDFGYIPSASSGSIGTLVWEDINADGNLDSGEDGIDDVTVDLYWDKDADGLLEASEPKIGTTTTAGGGIYLFDNLPTLGGISYIVDISDQQKKITGYWHSRGTLGINDNSQEDVYPIALGGANPIVNLTADFGYYIDAAALGNKVWIDRNQDGIQDENENGFEQAIVSLSINYPNGSTIVITDSTNTLGHFAFENLLLDEDYNKSGGGSVPAYTLSVTTPTSFSVTTIDVNSNANDKEDSDDPSGIVANTSQGKLNVDRQTDPNTEEDIASYDFGYFMDCDNPVVHYAMTNGAVTTPGQTTDYFFQVTPQVTPLLSTAEHEYRSGEQEGVIRATEYCVKGDWTYFYNPLDPAEYLLAIKQGTNVTPIEYVELRVTNDLSSRYASDADDATFVMARDWFVKTKDNDPFLDVGSNPTTVDVRFYFVPEEFEKMLNDAKAQATAWGADNIPTEEDVFWFYKEHFDPTTDINSTSSLLLPHDITSKRNAATNSLGVNTTDNDTYGSLNVGNGKNYIQFNSIDVFSGGTGAIHINKSILPVELTRFEARLNECDVKLIWAAETEVNFNLYEVQWSGDGIYWQTIKVVNGSGGTTNQAYQYVDEDASSQNYYRLKMIDDDGSFEYSDIISIETDCDNEDDEVNVYPNPMSIGYGILSVKFYSKRKTSNFTITDMKGRIIKVVNFDVEREWNTLQLDVSELSVGTYNLRMEGNRRSKMFIIIE